MSNDTVVCKSSSGKDYFSLWLNRLSAPVAAKVANSIYKLEVGNLSNTKYLRDGVWEFKLNTGPGYRIYFSKIGQNLILLLTGGTKTSQQKDINLAIELLKDYKKSDMH